MGVSGSVKFVRPRKKDGGFLWFFTKKGGYLQNSHTQCCGPWGTMGMAMATAHAAGGAFHEIRAVQRVRQRLGRTAKPDPIANPFLRLFAFCESRVISCIYFQGLPLKQIPKTKHYREKGPGSFFRMATAACKICQTTKRAHGCAVFGFPFKPQTNGGGGYH